MANHFKKLAACGIGLIAAWLFAEIFLSMRWDNYWQRSGRSIRLTEHTPGISRTYIREGISKDLKGKVSFRTDKDGFILPNLMEDRSLSSPHFTIAFLGGSTTECLIVKEDLRFPVLAGKKLKSSLCVDIFVINSGCAGDTTQDSINSLFNKIVNYNPDIAVMLQAVNDAGLLLSKGNYRDRMVQEPANGFKEIFRILTTKSRVLGLLRDSYAQLAINREVILNAHRNDDGAISTDKHSEPAGYDEVIGQFTSRLNVFVDMCRDFGITPVLMTQPFMNKPKRQLYGFEARTFRSGMLFLEPFNDQIRKVSAEKGALLVDLEKQVPKDGRYFYDEVHFTDEGSRLVSDIIAAELLKVLKKENAKKNTLSS